MSGVSRLTVSSDDSTVCEQLCVVVFMAAVCSAAVCCAGGCEEELHLFQCVVSN